MFSPHPVLGGVIMIQSDLAVFYEQFLNEYFMISPTLRISLLNWKTKKQQIMKVVLNSWLFRYNSMWEDELSGNAFGHLPCVSFLPSRIIWRCVCEHICCTFNWLFSAVRNIDIDGENEAVHLRMDSLPENILMQMHSGASLLLSTPKKHTFRF